jgi:hypothetical protein
MSRIYHAKVTRSGRSCANVRSVEGPHTERHLRLFKSTGMLLVGTPKGVFEEAQQKHRTRLLRQSGAYWQNVAIILRLARSTRAAYHDNSIGSWDRRATQKVQFLASTSVATRVARLVWGNHECKVREADFASPRAATVARWWRRRRSRAGQGTVSRPSDAMQ